MIENFTAQEIARYAQESIIEDLKENTNPEAKKVPYIWLLRPLKKDIVNAIKTSIYRDDIDKNIIFWARNNKYFVTDKGIVYSISIYKTNYKDDIEEDTFNELLYTEYESIAQLEDARNNAKLSGVPFICRQLRRLKPENRQLELKIRAKDVNNLSAKGYKIKKKLNDSTCRYDYFVRISQTQFIDIVLNGKEVTAVKSGRKGKEFAILAKGVITVYKTKKECYEKMFASICSLITFKRATKDKDIGDVFAIKGLCCEIVNPSRAH